MGLFDFLKRKESLSIAEILLKMPDDQFAEAVYGMFKSEIPATHTMGVVAYQNFMLSIPVIKKFMAENGQTFAYDEFMRGLFDHLSGKKDDFSERRFGWLTLGFSQLTLTRRASKNPDLHGVCSTIWVMMAESGFHLKSLLSENIVWKPNEKLYFSDLKDGPDGVKLVTNLIVPKSYRADPRFATLGQKHSFWVSTF
jgi:hypothetical protein